jgi:transposase
MSKRQSKLNTPEIVDFLRSFTIARLRSNHKHIFTLKLLGQELEYRFAVRVHKSTVSRFLKRLGLEYSRWGSEQ